MSLVNIAEAMASEISQEEAQSTRVAEAEASTHPVPDYVVAIRFSDSCIDSDKCFIEQPDGYYHRKGRHRIKEKHEKYIVDKKIPTYVFLYCRGVCPGLELTKEFLNDLDNTFFSFYRFYNYELKLVATLMRIPKSEILEFGFANYESQYEDIEEYCGITKEKFTLDNYVDVVKQYYLNRGLYLDDIEALIPRVKKEWIFGEYGVEFDREKGKWVCTGKIR